MIFVLGILRAGNRDSYQPPSAFRYAAIYLPRWIPRIQFREIGLWIGAGNLFENEVLVLVFTGRSAWIFVIGEIG